MKKRHFSPLDKVLSRIDGLDSQNLSILVRRIERERDLMETVLDTLREGVIVLSGDGSIDYANSAAVQLLGVSIEKVTGAELRRISPDIAKALELPELVEALTREIEVTYPESRFLRLHLTRVGSLNDSESSRRVAVLSDVTKERVQTEDRIESERIDSIVALAAGVAHEIGNPLNAIGLHLQVLQRAAEKLGESPEAKKVRDAAEVCQGEIKRLDGIVRDFLGAVRPTKPNLVDTDLVAVVAETMNLLQDQLKQLGIRVSVDVSSEIPFIHADRNQIKQALFNVMKNSLEALDRGGDIFVNFSTDDEWVILAIKDTGVGIPADKLTRVFDAYYSTKASGGGLGMMILLKILRAHGGTIDIASTPNVGTTVTLRFPLKHRRVRTLDAPKA
ncbi:MAG: PAS domain-containing protein [Opitutales bacterium]|nr:PAS domain-containing protein [Opitutales bacterium]